MAENKWRHRDDRVLLSEYKLMDRKESKLREEIALEDKLIRKHKHKIGLTLEEMLDRSENTSDGYYSRYVHKDEQKAGPRKQPPGPHKPPVHPGRSTNASKPSTAGGLKKKSSLGNVLHSHNNIRLRDYIKNEQSERTSSKNKKVAFENANAHANSQEYVNRILSENRHRFLHDIDRDKSASKVHRDSLEEDVVEENQCKRRLGAWSQQGTSSHKYLPPNTLPQTMRNTATFGKPGNPLLTPSTGYQTSRGYLETHRKRESVGSHSKNQSLSQGIRRPNQQLQSTNTVDLAEFVSEECAQWERTSHQPEDKLNPYQSQHSQQSPTTPIPRDILPQSKPVHPRQISFENALKLREGKIFAKFNKELKIYDLRDLDCKVGIDMELLLKNRSAGPDSQEYFPIGSLHK